MHAPTNIYIKPKRKRKRRTAVNLVIKSQLEEKIELLCRVRCLSNGNAEVIYSRVIFQSLSMTEKTLKALAVISKLFSGYYTMNQLSLQPATYENTPRPLVSPFGMVIL